MSTVGIIGAGIAGLTAAYRLDQEGASVQVFEASDRVGGVIRSEETEGFLVEHGPNSIRAGSATLEAVIDDLELRDERVWATDVATTRYVVRNGKPTALPTSIGSFLSTDLFSTRAKLRLLAEPFIGRPDDSNDESMARFTERRLGREMLDYAVAPFVGGVFAGSPEDLSVQHAFTRLATLEHEHGSLFLGILKNALSADSNGEGEAPSGLFSFRDGLQALPDALAEALGTRIVRNAPVTALTHDDAQWRLTVESPNGRARSREFDALIYAAPLYELDQIAFDTPTDLSPLTKVSYPPLSVLALGYPRESVDHPLDGFGLLVPPIEENLNILGTIFSSTLFPDRAPKDQVLLTTFVGGARAPDQATPETSRLQGVVERDLNHLLGINAAPSVRRHVHWPNAIPQYNVGYGRVKETLNELECRHPRLAFAGNYRQGVSVGDALTSGTEAARRLLDRLSEMVDGG